MKTRSTRAAKCPICDQPMKKNGKNPSGTQRWYCTQCRYSSTRKRVVDHRPSQFKEFLDYVTDTQPLRLATGVSRSTWQRDHGWCWQTRPIWSVTGEVYDQVFIDGIYIGYGWCVLTASTIINKKTKVIAYQLCQRENKPPTVPYWHVSHPGHRHHGRGPRSTRRDQSLLARYPYPALCGSRPT
ncbi:IS1/IS1595 family N-terminal zinc-binding domain-containing protein [Arcanobacterium canis]